MTLDLFPTMTTHQQLIHLPIMAAGTTKPPTPNELHRLYDDQAQIDANIRDFWKAFPCPPSWRPSLLTEMNISKLGPRIGESVKSFLVGKCQPEAIVDPHPGWGDGDPMDGIGPRGSDHHATTNSSDLSWCTKTCQLAIGCSGVFVAMVIVVLALVCFNRSRRSHKMPSTRPSRQQLQMSTSTSDPVNWAEFSNTQVQFDDDIIYPPFRHRDLPSPPSQCHHPSCDPKWTCPNGPFHPLVRMSPSTTTYCTHGGYTAVYEKIDDDDEEEDVRERTCNHGGTCGTRERTGNISNSVTNGVPFIPTAHPDTASRQREEETGFNGDGFAATVTALPRYFELEGLNQPTAPAALGAAGLSRENDAQWNNRNKYCFNSFQVHSAFLNSPSAASCNQLCATCVASVVSQVPAPCLSGTRQNGFIPNNNSFNPIPMETAMSNISTNLSGYHPPNTATNNMSTNLSGYLPPNTSSFRPSVPLSDCLPCSNSENNPMPNNNDNGCDLRQRGTFKTDNSTNNPQHPNGNVPENDLVGAETNSVSPPNQGHACHMAQTTSPIGSPCRQWCPSCQHVPLLNGGDPSHPHSASTRPTPPTKPWYHFQSLRSSSSSHHHDNHKPPTGTLPKNDNNDDDYDDETFDRSMRSSNDVQINNQVDEIRSRNYLSAASPAFNDERWLNTGGESDQQGMDKVQTSADRCGASRVGAVSEEDPATPALALHSHYFNKNKTSMA